MENENKAIGLNIDVNINDLILSKDSSDLLHYYKLLMNKRKNLFLTDNQCNDIKSNYFNLQKNIYSSLDSIYKNLKFIFKNEKNETHNYLSKTIISSYETSYTKLVSNIYYQHLQNNKYVPENIKKFIMNNYNSNNNNNSFILQYTYNDNTIKITINFIIYVNYEKLNNPIIEKYDKYFFHMLALIKLIRSLTYKECTQNELNVNIFMTPYKRHIEKTVYQKVMGAKNINGGFSYSCPRSDGLIVIYRQEEFFKVFCHELCHNYGVDKYMLDFVRKSNYNSRESNIYKNFISNFNLSKNINNNNYDIGIQECLVEFWALFLNISLFTYNNIISDINITIYANKELLYVDFFDELFKYEIVHTFLQTHKILDYNNITLDSILSKTNIKNKKMNNYKESTHVFSYIILKLFLLINYKLFINSNISLSSKKTNQNENYKISLKYSLTNVNKFFNYIVTISKTNSDYIRDNLYYFDNIVRNLKFTNFQDRDKDSNKEFYNLIKHNMKMTCIEFI